MRVLVVDDDAACRQAFARLLQGEGATVTVAAGARQGLLAFKASRPDVVVSDLVMAGEDGCWLMSRVLADVDGTDRRPRGIVVTAMPESQVWERCRAAGFHAFLPKTHDSRALVDLIARFACEGPR